MDMDELRSRLAMILAIEEQEPTDWREVDRLASELQRDLPFDAMPESVHRYLDDVDIRSRDRAYALSQRRDARCFVETGDYDDGVSIPPWGCALVLLGSAGLIKWLLL